MLDPSVRVFLAVAKEGSFTKAAQSLFLTSTAVMKQINTLEGELGLKLFVRSPRGVVLTPAGESLAQDGRKLLAQWEKAVAAARQVQNGAKRVIRVGTSALYPCGELISLWDKHSGEHPEFQFQVIPFDDAQTASLRRELGKNMDVLVGPFDSLLTQEYCRLLPLGEHRFYVSMPRNHPLSGKDRIALEDLDGCRVMLQKPGNSPVNDRVREDILKACHQVTILDAPNHFDLEVFNRAQSEGCLLVIPACWKDLHPSLVAVPLDTPHTLPYGVVYSARAGENVLEFVKILQHEAEKIK